MSYHFIGLGGIGMSALARILIDQKKSVKGSDVSQNATIESLKKQGAIVHIGHKEENISEDDLVIFSTAIDKANNPEYLKAKKLNLKMLHRSDLLDEVMSGSESLLVTGTHGKTTTTSLLTSVLLENNDDPSFVIGGILQSKKTNGYYGKGKYFVAEADESDGSFIKSNAYGAIVTNLEQEHMSYWKDFEKLKKAFLKFFSQVENKDLLFWFNEDPELANLNPNGKSYGFNKNADIRIKNVRHKGFISTFDIICEDKSYFDIELNLIGNHNILNATSVFAMCIGLGIDQDVIRKAFFNFQGISRRLEKISEHREVIFYDDYAHHPTEIKATLSAIRDAIEEKRLICVFQPHRYSRVKDLLDEFSKCFEKADIVIITDIYKASETPIEGISEQRLEELIQQNTKAKVIYIKDEDLERDLIKTINPFDVVVALGAGDISKKIRHIANEFSKEDKKIKLALLYGGRSLEHEVSISSFEYINQHLDKSLFDIELFKINKDGFWGDSEDIISPETLKKILDVDVCFPIFHGPYGEDGIIQGFLDTLDISYIGCDHKSSSICMNKAWTKILAKDNQIITSNFVEISSHSWQKNRDGYLEKIKKLDFPVYVKASSLGSSIGIEYVINKCDIIDAITNVFEYDHDLIIEEEVLGNEISVGIIGNDYIHVSLPCEIASKGNFNDYNEKYVDTHSKKYFPARLSKDKIKKVQNLARIMYEKATCKGFARVDFFYKDNEFYFNEINPISGCTKESIFFKMFKLSNIEIKDILNRLCILAMHKKRKNRILKKII